jgi:hypothetical protein
MRIFGSLCTFALILHLAAGKGKAAEDLRLSAPQNLVDSGLLQYVLPRFSLKTGVRVEVVPEDAQADLMLTSQDAGKAVFKGPNTMWSLMVLTDSEGASRLEAWLGGDIGKRTITSFQVDGSAPFSLPETQKDKVVAVSFDGELRAMRNWDQRFQTFFALNPHPAFTQVADVTPPFPIDRPSPIIPVEMTLDDLEAILAYVSTIEPADLGAPLQHQ